MKKDTMIIGWQEWVALPDLELPAIQAKIDTGARTSSLHAHKIKYFVEKGIEYVSFEVVLVSEDRKIRRKCSAKFLEYRKVKSSTGETQLRPVIRTRLMIQGRIRRIDLNLTNRAHMGMMMLIGREALKNKILVDPSRKFLHGKLLATKIEKLYIG